MILPAYANMMDYEFILSQTIPSLIKFMEKNNNVQDIIEYSFPMQIRPIQVSPSLDTSPHLVRLTLAADRRPSHSQLRSLFSTRIRRLPIHVELGSSRSVRRGRPCLGGRCPIGGQVVCNRQNHRPNYHLSINALLVLASSLPCLCSF